LYWRLLSNVVDRSRMSNKVLVLGSSGRLGSYISKAIDSKLNLEIISHSRNASPPQNADLTNRDQTFKMLGVLRPDVIINTIALAEVEACEKNPNRAYRTNVLTTQNIVEWISEVSAKCHLIHISTDHVYDGEGRHKESSVNLTNYYAYSKFASELVAKQIPSTILRTNFVGKSVSDLRQTFSDWVVSSLMARRNIELVNDVWFSPVSLKFLLEAVALTVRERLDITANLGSWGGLTKFEFGHRIADLLDLDQKKIHSVTAAECLAYVTYRPKNMVMDNSFWEATTGLKCPSTEEVVDAVAREYV
jgi:dTDP-4-dehydrorhamnose reductase